MARLRHSPTTHGKLPSQSHCNKCGGIRTHVVLNEHQTEWDDEVAEGQSVGGWDKYYVLQCAGCSSIHFRHDSSFSEDTDASGYPNIRVEFFPPAYARRRPAWLNGFDGPFWHGEHPVGVTLEEVYVALQNSLPKLAAMGIRALVEHIMIEKVGDRGTFRANIDAFFEAGHLAQVERDVFQNTLLEVGHATIHRAYTAPADDLEVLMDIVEQIVFNLYVRPERIAEMAKIPGRK